MTDHRTYTIPLLFERFQGLRPPQARDLATTRAMQVRPLGCCERFFHRYALSCPVHFCLVAQIRGSIEAGTLRAALDEVRGRYGALRVRIHDEAEAGPAFYSIDDPIDLRTYPVASDVHWPQLVEVELNRSFDADRGPLLRATALLAPDRTAVVLTFHHAVADALSGIRVLDALLRALAGERLDAVAHGPPIEAMIAGCAAGPVAAHEHARDIARLTDPDPATSAPRSVARISVLDWSEDDTNKLIACCKANRTTVHGAICAAAAHHLPASDDGAVRLHCPMDLSAAVGQDIVDCGLFVGAEAVEIPAADRGAVWPNARNVADRLRAARSLPAAALMLNRLSAAFPPTIGTDQVGRFLATQPPSSAVISNLGVLPLQVSYGSWMLEAVWGPAMLTHPPANRQTIGLNTFAGRLRMVHQSQQPISGLLNQIRETLMRRHPIGP